MKLPSRERRLRLLLFPISLNGASTGSGNGACVMLEERGEPLIFLERNPALKRLLFFWTWREDRSGGAGMGEDSLELLL
jgi:hypothetical protein